MDKITNFISESYKKFGIISGLKNEIEKNFKDLDVVYLIHALKHDLGTGKPFEVNWNIPNNEQDFMSDLLDRKAKNYSLKNKYWDIDGREWFLSELEQLCSQNNNVYVSEKWRLFGDMNIFTSLLNSMGIKTGERSIDDKEIKLNNEEVKQYLQLKPLCAQLNKTVIINNNNTSQVLKSSNVGFPFTNQ